MPITILDGVLIAFTLVSAILAMVRGFSREILSIASWVAAGAAAYFFYPLVTPFLRRRADGYRNYYRDEGIYGFLPDGRRQGGQGPWT